MKYSIALLDTIFLFSSLAAILILIVRRRKRLRYDIRLIVSALLIFNALYSICLFLEWTGVTHFLEPYEDVIGAMVPMMWAFFFYAILQSIAGSDLKRSEDRYRRLFEESNDLIVIHKLGKIIDVNQKMCDVLGYSKDQLLNMSIQDLHHRDDTGPESIERIENILKYSDKIFEDSLVRANGEMICVEVSTSIIDLEKGIGQGILRDISERKTAEEDLRNSEKRLRQTQKMEAVGTLAGGIAHDFNNILSIIFGFTDLALMDIESPEKAADDLAELKNASLRAKELIRQILTISRQTEQEKQPIRITPIVMEALRLLRSTIPSSIEIISDLTSQATVLADSTQIHQIIMNLCTNAYHAMGDRGGMLTVSVGDILISAEDIMIGNNIAPGKYVRIEVSDTGHGMDDRTRERIFEPYYTTKKTGEGTGLGLAVVHGIVEGHKGKINVYSESGVGTTFHVYIPLFDGAPGACEANERPRYNMEGKERILFVDDEENIVNIASETLSRYGYKVNVFNDSTCAYNEFQKDPSGYDLIITDMTMPGMNGIELAEKLHQIRGDVPVILCSGYSKLINSKKIKDMEIKFIAKPIIMSDLIRTIRLMFEKVNYEE